jgi:hypothetical protein
MPSTYNIPGTRTLEIRLKKAKKIQAEKGARIELGDKKFKIRRSL